MSGARPFPAYVICTAPRSGSTLLCSLLRATGVAGHPGSHFHEPSVADWAEDHGVNPAPDETRRELLAQVFRAAQDTGRGGTGVFGLRLQRDSFDFFARQLAILHPDPPDDAARMQAAFGPLLFIHLTRPDKLAQAVSYVMATQTGLWHRAPDGRELERLSPPRAPAYDAPAIRERLDEMTAHDAAWRRWFANQGIAPLSVTYDDLTADPVATLRRLLAALGLDPAAGNGITPGTARLADATSADWVRRFRAELSGP
ncbi:Stf0 sulfotransferase family protein [Seohaeicola saemankumensis]|nr:Stf0 family sulfotransferase [Seohaeicola saemankumensis]MCA0872656.1 Stf0 sulfotransferase family protein [Seohaeicola saemankumensis]